MRLEANLQHNWNDNTLGKLQSCKNKLNALLRPTASGDND